MTREAPNLGDEQMWDREKLAEASRQIEEEGREKVPPEEVLATKEPPSEGQAGSETHFDIGETQIYDREALKKAASEVAEGREKVPPEEVLARRESSSEAKQEPTEKKKGFWARLFG